MFRKDVDTQVNVQKLSSHLLTKLLLFAGLITCHGDMIPLHLNLWHHCTFVVVILHAIPPSIVLILSFHHLSFLSSPYHFWVLSCHFGVLYCPGHIFSDAWSVTAWSVTGWLPLTNNGPLKPYLLSEACSVRAKVILTGRRARVGSVIAKISRDQKSYY
jgi:hypothetical protein